MQKGECTMKKVWLAFGLSLLAGVVLHFVYDWFPNPVTALIAPVNESLWEHAKLLFWPLTVTAFCLCGGKMQALAARLLAAVAASLSVVAAGYIYHILLRGEALAVDVVLYAAAMALGFWLAEPLEKWTVTPGRQKLAVALTCIMAVLFIWFTYAPPETVIFADLTGGVRTFLTIPV